VVTETQYYDKTTHRFYVKNDAGEFTPMGDNPIVAALRA